MPQTYKGFTREQLIDILADFAVYTAEINNLYNSPPMNTNKADYISLYRDYPIHSKHSAFSLSVMFDNMIIKILKSQKIAAFDINFILREDDLK